MKSKCLVILSLLCLTVYSSSFARWKASHVVFIGMDGWGAYSVPRATGIPNIRNLMLHGAYTLHKRSVYPTASAINWASMWNGCPTEIHGYTEWNSSKPTTAQPEGTENERGLIPTVFSLLREQYPGAVTAWVGWWDVIGAFIDTAAINYKYIVRDREANIDGATRHTCDMILRYKPALTFVSFDEPDAVGHHIGHDTPAYYDTLRVLDRSIGKIIAATKEAGIFESTIFILTTDHGGVGKGHGGRSLREYEGPFIISGHGVKPIGAFPESMMQYDIAATTAYIFSLKTPQVWVGRPMKQVFK